MELYGSGSTANLSRLVDVCVVSLQKNRLTITTAESCTGGMLSAKLVGTPGVSEVSQEGYITYSDEAKRRLLDVNKIALKKYGAVSTQIAREMTIGAVSAASVDIAVPTTGTTGPDDDDDKKPVGLVFIGCYMNDRVTMEEHRSQGDRTAMRTQAVRSALRLLRATILEDIKA